MPRLPLGALLTVAFLLAATGCGDSGPDVKIAPAPAPNAAAPAIKPKVAGGPQAGPAAKRTQPAAQKKAAPQPELPPVDIENAFAIVTEPYGFEIVGPEPDVAETDQFLAEIPQPGFDSTTFNVTLPAPERTAAAGVRSSFKLPEGFVAVPDVGRTEDGLPLQIRCEKDDGLMVLIPAGPFRMGTGRGPSEAAPEISVYLDAYYIDRHEVTLAQYAAFQEGAETSGKKRVRPDPKNAADPENHPALGLPWSEAKLYADWAGKQLPTEAQWEKAARGPDSFEHPWGNGRAVWPHARSTDEISPVMSYRTDVSPYGVFDMSGNAREWCADWFSSVAFKEASPTGATLRNWEGPKRPSSPNLRVVKGGSPDWTVWHRAGVNMRETLPRLGFRGVLNVTPPSPPGS